MEERRKFVRFNAPFCVHYSDKNIPQETPGVIKDISYGGARVIVDTLSRIDNASAADLSILFPKDTLKVSGLVVWVKESGSKKEIGICFQNIPSQYKDTIYNYIFKYFKEELTSKWWNI